MQKSQIDSVTLVLAVLAGALALMRISGPFMWMSSIGGLALLLLLLSFDQEGYRTVFQSLAFSTVCGFCTAIAAGIIFQLMASHGEVHLASGHWATEYLPLTCAFATAIFWIIDLMRMNARKAAPIRVPRALGETRLFAEPRVSEPIHAATPQSAVFVAPAPAPPAQQAVNQPFQTPQPEAPQPVIKTVPEAAPPSQPPGQPRELPTATSMFAVVPQTTATTEPQPLNPGPAPIIPRSGKETMIYVSLLGEGLNVLRSVRAEPLGHDYYRILEEMPEGETWQFQQGQVVRCKKKNLSSGKAMVAMEEAPRST